MKSSMLLQLKMSHYFFYASLLRTQIYSLCTVIVRVSVVLKRTVGDSDWRFDNLSGRHLQSHCDIYVARVPCHALSACTEGDL